MSNTRTGTENIQDEPGASSNDMKQEVVQTYHTTHTHKQNEC